METGPWLKYWNNGEAWDRTHVPGFLGQVAVSAVDLYFGCAAA